MILTSCRVICVNKKNSAFKAFDLPLSLISNEGFAQPIFGANYIHGKCKPLLNSLPGDINFKIWLMNGGCGTFAPAYLKMVASCQRNKNWWIKSAVQCLLPIKRPPESDLRSVVRCCCCVLSSLFFLPYCSPGLPLQPLSFLFECSTSA